MGHKKRYTGQAIDVTFEPRRCVHAGACVRGLPAVFDPHLPVKIILSKSQVVAAHPPNLV